MYTLFGVVYLRNQWSLVWVPTITPLIALSKSEHTSSLLSSARKNLTSLKISCFSVFEVDSVAMFKLARPPYWNWFGNWRLAGKRVVPSHLICTLRQNTLGLRSKRWVVNREKEWEERKLPCKDYFQRLFRHRHSLKLVLPFNYCLSPFSGNAS